MKKEELITAKEAIDYVNNRVPSSMGARKMGDHIELIEVEFLSRLSIVDGKVSLKELIKWIPTRYR